MSATPSPRLYMAGMSNLDHVWQVARFPPIASRTEAKEYRIQGGGPAATAAVAAARLGARVALCTSHGDDAAGAFARAELERYGVDCSQIRTVPGATTPVSAVLVAPGGERYIFPYRDVEGMDRPEFVDRSLVERADCVLTDMRYPRMSEAVLTAARELGVPTVTDFGNARYWHLAKHADYLIVSEECADEVSGGKKPSEALSELRQFETQVVGITLGERGFLYAEGGRTRHVPAVAVEVVDTTGAGDVFHGAYAFGVACGWNAERCALFASAAAALSCGGLGRSAVAGLEQVERLVREYDARALR